MNDINSMTVYRSEIRMVVTEDNTDIAVQAEVEFLIPIGDKYNVIHTMQSPGYYGIDRNASQEYLNEIFKEERETLEIMLVACGVTIINKPVG